MRRLADCLRAVISGRGGLAAARQHSWMRVMRGLVVAASLAPAMAFAGDSVPRSDPFPTQYKYPPKTRDIEERRHEVVETGLMYHNHWSPLTEPDIWWLNDRLFVVTALRDVPDAGLKKLTRVMRVDAVTGESSTVEAEGSMICWNPDREIAGFKPSNFDIDMGDGVRWLGKLDKAGNYQRLSPEPETTDKFCRATDLGLPTGGRSVALILREADGYIKLSEQGKRFDYEAEAILMRPGQPPKKLGVLADNLSRTPFLPYFNKYFLMDRTNPENPAKSTRGPPPPFGLSLLLSPEGEIEVLPFPEIIFDFGLRGLGWIQPTPHGQLFFHNGFRNLGPQGLFLLQGDRLVRIWGGPGWFARGRNEFINNVAVSPDGCRVAMVHSPDPSGRTIRRRPISILNLCKAL